MPSSLPQAQAGLWVRSPGLFFSPQPKSGPQPRSPGAEGCLLTLLSVPLRLTPSVCDPPHAAQPHQLAKHIAKYLVKLQRRRRRRRPGNSSVLWKSLADTREETSLKKPHKKHFSCNTTFSGSVTTHFWKPPPHSVFPGLALTSHPCKTHRPGEVLAAGPGAMAASGKAWPLRPVPAQRCSGHLFPTCPTLLHRPRVVQLAFSSPHV